MFKKEQAGFNLLKSKDVYAILDGDTSFRSDALDEEVSLPYQSGPKLVEVLNKFGIDASYGSSSRWMYVEALLEHCIENNRVSDMLAYFFNLARFQKEFSGLTPEEIKRRHAAIVEGAIAAINSMLFFGGHELRCFGNNYVIQSMTCPRCLFLQSTRLTVLILKIWPIEPRKILNLGISIALSLKREHY